MSFFLIYLSERFERSYILLNIHTVHFHLFFPAAAWLNINSVDYRGHGFESCSRLHCFLRPLSFEFEGLLSD